MALIIEEAIIDAVILCITNDLPVELVAINLDLGLDVNHELKTFRRIFDDEISPLIMDPYPSACVWVDDSDDDIKDRAVTLNVSSIKVLCAWIGHGRVGYRYGAALTSMFLKNPTLNGKVGRCRVVQRKYFSPVVEGDTEVRVAMLDLEVHQEVRRS